jgi:hypothetical protein
MITRETKVGLLVASSFVCLVGIVLASKLMREDSSPADPGGAAPALEINRVAPPTAAAKAPAPKSAPAQTDRARNDAPVENGKQAIVSTGAGDTQPGPVKPASAKEIVEATGGILPPPDEAVQTKPGPVKSAPTSGGPTGDNTEAQVKDDKGLLLDLVKDNDSMTAGQKEDEVKKELAEQVKKKDNAHTPTTEEDTTGKKTQPMANPILDLVAAPSENKKDDPVPPAGKPAQEDVTREGAKSATDAAAPPSTKLAPGIVPITSKPASESDSKPAPLITTKDPAKLDKSVAVPTTGPSGPADTLPILGSKPKVASAPVSVSPPTDRSGQLMPPRVESFDTSIHTVRQGDTFASISQQYFESDKYGAALREHNARRIKNESLERGQKVNVPEKAYLERHYSFLIPGYSPVKLGKAEAITSPNTEGSRPPAGGSTSADPAVVRVAGEKAPPGGPSYMVRGERERLYFIAKEVLGDANRWPEIYRLNPQVAPEGFIPVGTELRLPAGAQVPK